LADGTFRRPTAPQRCGALSHDDDLAPLFTQAGTGTRTTTYNYWLRRYRATLKPKDFPDRAGPGRPLDNFELLKFALVWDASGQQENKKQL
jgi:hypothetical protein